MIKLLGVAATVAAVVVGVAQAITYGQPDGNRHPNVGALFATFESGTFPYCSGTLISPRVFLTAAHCDIGVERVKVTFESEFDPNGKSFNGTFHPHPDFDQAQGDPADIAVVVFDKPIKGISPGKLPTAGLLDGMKAAGTLEDTLFTNVGYGGQESVTGPGGNTIEFLDIREFSVSSFNAINKAWLRLSQNQATGDGGTCYGDSGGPQFLGAGADKTVVVVSITVTGDVWCKATNVTYRTDTKTARSFLGKFVALP